jgi:hypothetical protein
VFGVFGDELGKKVSPVDLTPATINVVMQHLTEDDQLFLQAVHADYFWWKYGSEDQRTRLVQQGIKQHPCVYYHIPSNHLNKLGLLDDVLAGVPHRSKDLPRNWCDWVCNVCTGFVGQAQATALTKLRKFLLACEPHLACINKAAGKFFADDEEVMCKCVVVYPECFKYASNSLKNSRSLVDKLLSINAMVLQYAHAYCDDRELVLKAVSQCFRAFEYASKRLQADVEVIQHCIAQHKENPDKGAIVLKLAPHHIAQNPSIFEPAIDASPWEVVQVQDAVTQQQLLRAVEREPWIYSWLSDHHRADYKLAEAAISRNSKLFVYASGLTNDPRIQQLL